jgi:hypothetical protein
MPDASSSPGCRSEVPLCGVTYVSESLIFGSEAGWAAEIEQILHSSCRWNAGMGITGALLMTENRFAQVLEGAAPAILLSMDRISSDPRHRILRMEKRQLDRRRFSAWSVAFLGRHDEEAALLAPTRSFASGQDAAPVLALMHYLVREPATG